MPNDFTFPEGVDQHFNAQQPNLGYGKQTEASIDAVNQWMRSQPWWSQIRGANGGDLSKQQRQQILKQAQANGVVIDEGDMEIDKGGNINPKGHKLRNTLIVAGIAGATLATMGAAGAFAGGAGAAGGGAGAGAGLAGVEGGAYGLGSGALASLGSGAMGAAPLAGLGAGAAGAGGALASSQIGSGMMGPIAGGTSGSGMMAGAGAAGGAGSIAREIGTTAQDVGEDSFKKKLASALAAVGGAGVGRMIGGGGGNSGIPPELQQLLAMSMKQQQDLDPLRQNVTRGVNAMLPSFARGE